MRPYKLRYIIIICLCAFALAGCVQEEHNIEVDVNAKAAVILDVETGKVLYEKSPDKRFPPASTAKMMTAIVAIESLPLDTEITPTKEALYVEPTIAGLKPGVTYKLEDLLAAILIKSANDAARVIAVEVSGTEEDFAILMNEKAKEIGMTDTNFMTASGLPTGRKDKQYTTARDLAVMMRYAAGHEVILETISQKDKEIYGSNGKKIYLKTHNKSLLRDENAPWGKTGYTIEAKRTFAGVDPSMDPDIAFGLLKSNSLWTDITTLKDKGLELHQFYQPTTFLSKLLRWIKNERFLGKSEMHLMLDRKKSE